MTEITIAWTDRISGAWNKTRDGIIEVGQLLIDAKDALPHGEFTLMIESRLPFSARTAQMLMTISGDPRLTNTKHVSYLPPSWGTLHKLTKLSDSQFDRAFDEGIIRPDMQRKDVITILRDEARKKSKEKRAAREVAPEELPDRTDRYNLIQEPVDNLTVVDDDSVDCIITDPPYPEKYLPVYSDLSLTASRVLKPGGSCFVMVGQSYLPEILDRLSENLKYQWTLAYLTPGGQAVQLWQRKAMTFWKPVLWFVKGEYDGDWVGDVSSSKENDKDFHHWGQSESGMADLVKRASKAGDIILDPFCGGGTTGVVAVDLNRCFIGSDVDAKALDTTKVRLASV